MLLSTSASPHLPMPLHIAELELMERGIKRSLAPCVSLINHHFAIPRKTNPTFVPDISSSPQDAPPSYSIMHSSLLCITILLSSASTFVTAHGSNAEYKALGCPTGTKPWASERQQLAALTDFANLLYIQKAVDKAENTYVAADFINHAPEVPGDGRALAIATLKPMLNTSTIEIQRIFVGRNADGEAFGVTYFKGISQVLGLVLLRTSGG